MSDPQRLPPVATVATVTIAVVVAGGITMASYLPRRPPLVPAYAAVGIAGALMIANLVSLTRLKTFAWATFFLVARWALAAYLVVAGMLEYVFVLDHTRGAPLLVLTFMLAIFGVNVPLLLAFSVARYQPASGAPP
jgi:hypothetical protein